MTAAPGDGRLRLAIVDDHELVREGIRALLETHASEAVAIVYSGDVVAEAIAVVRASCCSTSNWVPELRMWRRTPPRAGWPGSRCC